MTKQSDIGDTREYAGITFTAAFHLKTWDGEPRGVVWEAGPIASRIDERWTDTTGHRFCANNIHCETFEKAAVRAIKCEASRARRAREFLAVYDAPELAELRAKADALV